MSAKLWGGALLVGVLIVALGWVLGAPEDSFARRDRNVTAPSRDRRSLEERIRELEEGDEAGEQDESGNRVGRVVTESGQPVPDATFHFGECRFRTAADGRAAFRWPADERTVEFDVRHPAYVDLLEERTDTGEEQVFTLRRGHTIRGRVLFADGSPVPEVPVGAWSDEGTNRPRGYTDARGSFEFTGVPDHAVSIEADTGEESSGGVQRVRWSPGDPAIVFTVRHSYVLLRIRSADGQPLRETRVREFTVESDRNVFKSEHELESRNVFHGLHNRRSGTKFVVFARGYRARSLTIPPAPDAPALCERFVDLEPFAAMPASVRVERGDGRPASFVMAALVDEEGDIVRSLRVTQSADGPVRIDGVEPGAPRVRVWQERQPLLFRDMFSTALAQTATITLPRGSYIRVPQPRGSFLSQGVLVRRIEDGLRVGMVETRERGILRSASLVPAGRYRIEIVFMRFSPPGMVSQTKEFDVQAGTDVDVDWSDSVTEER